MSFLPRVLPLLIASACLAGCSDNTAPTASKSSPELGQILSDVVTNGVFTNIYVYPNPSTQTWEEHMASLRPLDASDFSRASIDDFTDRTMQPGWPSYYDSLYQYHCGTSTDCGINPPQFFGSGVASQSCVDAALADASGGVLQWDTIRSLANCHLDGRDPSPQVNLIFSPDIPIAKITVASTGPEMCSTSNLRAWHSWGINTPDFSALPTSATCAGSIKNFTRSMSHEMVEILTDPGGMGYGDFPNYTAEAADLCSGDYTVVNGDSLARYYSNSDGNCQPRLDAPAGSESTTWQLGAGSPLQRFTASAQELALDVPSSRVNTNANATQVQIVVKTGADDLRGDSGVSADVTLRYAGGSTLTTNISHWNHWDNGQTHSAILNLPSTPLRVSDIEGVTITRHSSIDQWNVDKVALVVSYPTGSTVTVPPHPIVHKWLDASELPLVRFTGDVHDKQLVLSPKDVGVGVESLKLVIFTGNDNLNGGSSPGDNCDVDIGLASGDVITLTNVNHGHTWAGWTKHTVSIPVPAGLKGGDIDTITLRTGFGGGLSGDNWNVERVELFAGIDPVTLLGVVINSPTATDYLHTGALALDFSATDAGGPGLADVTASLDGAQKFLGAPLSPKETIPLLTSLDLGTHTFTVDATDVWGNTASKSVTFNVVATSSSIESDITALGGIDSGLDKPLLAKLKAAAAARARGQCDTAARIYQAFINQVRAQSGHKIDPATADILIADAGYLVDHCP